jgi:cellulose synthase/poly-beta-1,6-N-acetylglucosamine synthase-like glycosyltransferase
MTVEKVAFVVIGRNEGERLGDCLRPLLAETRRVVYVDSASTDRSAEFARELGAVAIVLDPSILLSAARGRNVGFAEVRARFPDCDYVHFIDGDCVIAPGWLQKAVAFLDANPKVAVACGRRFERFPDASVYNRLCDEEWNTPVGKAEHSGGDALVRVAAFEQVGGFRSDLKAGEEPEMTSRMRASGWEIWRLNALMTEHDARILHFDQWWNRMIRGGFGFAEVWSSTGQLPQRVFGRQLRSAFTWTLAIPAMILLGALFLGDSRLLFLIPLAFALQIARIAIRRGFSLRAWQSAALLVGAKIPETIGALSYFLGKKADRLVDYKALPQ